MIVYSPPRTDLFETKAGIQSLPCACGPDAPCVWHWSKEVKPRYSKNDKGKQEEFYARSEDREGRGTVRKQQPRNNGLRADRHGAGKGPGKAVPKRTGKR